MRGIALSMMLATLGATAERHVPVAEPTTVIVGMVRSAITNTPIAGVTIFTEATGDSVRTDSTGRFVLTGSRNTTLLGFRKDGFMAFQIPILQLTTDTLRANVELRTDPLPASAFVNGTHLPYLCIVREAPERLDVTHACAADFRPPTYRRQIIKHNPWNPYFGPAGDGGGVLLATRESSAK